MKLIKYNRPKLPRNKYGNTGQISYFKGGVVTSDGELSIDSPSNPQPPSTNNPVQTQIIYESEWYNIQNKFVNSYATDKTQEEPRLDSYGNTMFDKNGEIDYVKKKTFLGNTWITVVENFDVKLLNSDNYRFVLMRWRKGKREGKRWRIPWFSPKYWETGDGVQGIKMDIAEQDCWWPCQGHETKWWNKSQVQYTNDGGVVQYRNKDYKDVLPVNEENITVRNRNILIDAMGVIGGVNTLYLKRTLATRPVFKNTNTNRMLVGCAIFKKTSSGAYGWQRVSNIAVVEIRLTARGDLTFRIVE